MVGSSGGKTFVTSTAFCVSGLPYSLEAFYLQRRVAPIILHIFGTTGPANLLIDILQALIIAKPLSFSGLRVFSKSDQG